MNKQRLETLMAKATDQQLAEIQDKLSKAIDEMREAGKDTSDLRQAHVWVCDELERRQPELMNLWYGSSDYSTFLEYITTAPEIVNC